jgi:hypothetical protein
MCTAKVSNSEARVMFRDRQKANFESAILGSEVLGYSPHLIAFMLHLLTYNYQERPTAAEALKLCRERMP